MSTITYDTVKTNTILGPITIQGVTTHMDDTLMRNAFLIPYGANPSFVSGIMPGSIGANHVSVSTDTGIASTRVRIQHEDSPICMPDFNTVPTGVPIGIVAFDNAGCLRPYPLLIPPVNNVTSLSTPSPSTNNNGYTMDTDRLLLYTIDTDGNVHSNPYIGSTLCHTIHSMTINTDTSYRVSISCISRCSDMCRPLPIVVAYDGSEYDIHMPIAGECMSIDQSFLINSRNGVVSVYPMSISSTSSITPSSVLDRISQVISLPSGSRDKLLADTEMLLYEPYISTTVDGSTVSFIIEGLLPDSPITHSIDVVSTTNSTSSGIRIIPKLLNT